MVCLRVADAFRRSFEVVVLASSQLCSRRALLQSLLFELRMPYRDLTEGELRLSLLERLQPSNDNPTDGLVLIVDEAQSLAPKLLEELRLITNLTRDGVPRVRLILCGTTRLEEMLGHPQMESLNQRLAARCYLGPLNTQETIRYLTFKIELCGAPISAVITDEAMRLVHRATDGVPRLIDQVVDSAIRIAADLKQRPISASIIEAAWARSQQLPLPWSDNAQSLATASPSIEYGLLEDDTEQDFRGGDTSYVHRATAEVQHAPASLERPHVHTYRQTFETAHSKEEPSVDPEVAYYEESIGLTEKPTPTIPPIPSAGSGLSRSIAKAWDSFIEPAQSHDETQEDYSNEHLFVHPTTPFEASVSNSQPKQLPELPSLPEFRLMESEPSDSYPHAPQINSNDLFGSDYEEEIWLTKQPEISPSPISSKSNAKSNDWYNKNSISVDKSLDYPSNIYDVPIEVVPDDQIDSSLYAFRDSLKKSYEPPLSMKSFADEAENTIEILDKISSVNLEAMTISADEAVIQSRTSAVEFNGAPPAESNSPSQKQPNISYRVSQSKLSRPPRASILSFADIQQDAADHVQDDRDLLVIEEDIMQISAGMPIASVAEARSNASINPYKQLFGKLRG